MAKLQLFKNVGNIPDPDTGLRSPRLQLAVTSTGIPILKYWRKRLKEGGIEIEKKSSQLKKVSRDRKENSDKLETTKVEDVKNAD